MFGFGELFGNMPAHMRTFNMQYRCLSVAMLPHQSREQRDVLENGGKIFLPPSALDLLTRLNIAYPMMFKLTNVSPEHQRVTHCGVLEFIAEEGHCHLPYWMMQNLQLEEQSLVQVQSVSLETATMAKFKPLNVEFMDISNPKAVLEVQLRHFACLTKGDVIPIHYNAMRYQLLVQEIAPQNAVSIIECDMNVEFDTPEGYVEPKPLGTGAGSDAVDEEEHLEESDLDAKRFKPFSCEGFRLDGKAKKFSDAKDDAALKGSQGPRRTRGIPNYKYKPGNLTFIRKARPKENPDMENGGDSFTPFAGEGHKLKTKK